MWGVWGGPQEEEEGRGEALGGSWWVSPWSRAGPRVLQSRRAAVLYQKHIPLSELGKEALSVWDRKGDDGVKSLSE